MSFILCICRDCCRKNGLSINLFVKMVSFTKSFYQEVLGKSFTMAFYCSAYLLLLHVCKAAEWWWSGGLDGICFSLYGSSVLAYYGESRFEEDSDNGERFSWSKVICSGSRRRKRERRRKVDEDERERNEIEWVSGSLRCLSWTRSFCHEKYWPWNDYWPYPSLFSSRPGAVYLWIFHCYVIFRLLALLFSRAFSSSDCCCLDYHWEGLEVSFPSFKLFALLLIAIIGLSLPTRSSIEPFSASFFSPVCSCLLIDGNF